MSKCHGGVDLTRFGGQQYNSLITYEKLMVQNDRVESSTLSTKANPLLGIIIIWKMIQGSNGGI